MQNRPGALAKYGWGAKPIGYAGARPASRLKRGAFGREAMTRCAGVDEVDYGIGDRVESRQRLSGGLIGPLDLKPSHELTGAEGAPSNTSEVALDGTENNTPGGYLWPYDVHGMEPLHYKEGVA